MMGKAQVAQLELEEADTDTARRWSSSHAYTACEMLQHYE